MQHATAPLMTLAPPLPQTALLQLRHFAHAQLMHPLRAPSLLALPSKLPRVSLLPLQLRSYAPLLLHPGGLQRVTAMDSRSPGYARTLQATRERERQGESRPPRAKTSVPTA